MSLFPLFKKKPFFSEEEKEQIVHSIREAEVQTSGEIRVYIESHCRFIDPVDRAMEIFTSLKMEETGLRNAVLIYVALKDRQLAVYGDSGIHEKTGDEFWMNAVDQMLFHFNKDNYADGISHVIREIGETLSAYFPYDKDTDRNELPDEIVFGK